MLSISELLGSNAPKQTISHLPGCGESYLLSQLIEQGDHLFIIITKDSFEAQRIGQELQFFAKDLTILDFPDWETLPYDHFSPHQHLISDRLKTLSTLKQIKKGLIVTTVTSLMHPLPPIDYIHKHSLQIKVGSTLNLKAFKIHLEQAGYRFVNQVIEHGECAFRGSIIDIFPMGTKTPFRIDLFDDTVETIKTFCPDTQGSIETIKEIDLLPAREFPLDEAGITHFRRQWRNCFSGNPSRCPIYEQISEGISPAGIEYYLPLFFEKTADFFDYLPEHSWLFFIEDTIDAGQAFMKEVEFRYEQRAHDISRPILKPQDFFIAIEKLRSKAKAFKRFQLYKEKHPGIETSLEACPKLLIDRKANIPLLSLKNYVQNIQAQNRCLIVAESAGRREVLIELLKTVSLSPIWVENFNEFVASNAPLAICEGPVTSGLIVNEQHLHIITEAEIFGQVSVTQKRKRSTDSNVIIRDLSELKLNAPVVHIEHGVGRYRGLVHLIAGGQKNEFLVIEYAGNAKVYVPVTALELISRYTGGDLEHAPLHRLGSGEWQKEKKKAQEKINDVACELLDVYAQREAKQGYQYLSPNEQYQAFVSQFPFEETLDQIKATEDIINDMTSKKPMDRLVCGDVGFGKTEVAMRSAFLAVQNGKQVCVLVPTTLLAGQHFENFSDRFAEFPINIELLSRFRTKKESEKVHAELEKGTVDIVIGTHKLFQKNINFKNLGLLIIDEEHRFGVKQKEFLKALRTDVDILSMTATPIPRTLNMAMGGLRDISIIATPPAKRLAIKTFVYEKNPPIIKEAILREILRGGQVFYLHNSVETIQRAKEELSELLPQAKIEIAHGQMAERQLEKIMADFYHHRFNVLICTTIIETGIDIPTANTIIIERADKFGLAQLHQLRGRVGRSHHQAYAYLLTPNEKALSKDAKKRLEALMSLEDLGAGFALATQDLEIRGAGELLGEEQSGNMHAIGFSLYMELLEQTVKALKKGETPNLDKPFDSGPEIKLNISTIIPEDYIYDVHTRLVLYKRIANASDKAELEQLQIEMIDRFGLLPPSVKHLFKVTQLKQEAKHLGIVKLTLNDDQGIITFCEKPNIDPGRIITLIQVHAKRFKLKNANALTFFIEKEKGVLEEVYRTLNYFKE